MTGTIINIQHYAVHDGPGIRTLVFFKGCPLQCAWCCNPESQAFEPQLRYISLRCRSCLTCLPHCEYSAVAVKNGQIQKSFDLCRQCISKSCIDYCYHDAVSISGRDISSAELFHIIEKDKDFYLNSDGGVTFSGGEPFSQAQFLNEMLKLCWESGIHTAVETCGWASRQAVQEALPFTDLFLFDLKIINSELHRKFTGKPNNIILDNLSYLASNKANITIRLPLIQEITDTRENIVAIAECMTNNGLKKICLEPYHSLGTDKYTEHGMKYEMTYLGNYQPETAIGIRNFFVERGFDCEIS